MPIGQKILFFLQLSWLVEVRSLKISRIIYKDHDLGHWFEQGEYNNFHLYFINKQILKQIIL